ncbi:hypothetical protein [Kordia sp.]|uniref:hypothetical protein n=1 Tax=Kordia sp. TaxID=1965332 RepID=UPI003D29C9E1
MIKYLDYIVPEDRLSTQKIFEEVIQNEMLPEVFSSPEEGIAFFDDTLNLKEVAIANSFSETEMLLTLMNRFFDQGIVSKNEIDLLILIGDDVKSGNRQKNLAHYIQHHCQLENSDVLVVSGNHCSNIEQAIILSENLLKAGANENIIIVGVNKLQNNADRVIGNYGIHGDGAGLVYVNKDNTDGISILGKSTYTNGILHKANMNENNFFLLCKNYITCISKVMKSYEIQPTDITKIIIQNANYMLINQCMNDFNFKKEQLYLDNIGRFGHLDCIDFIINLKSVLDEKPVLNSTFISFGTGWAGSNIALYLQLK